MKNTQLFKKILSVFALSLMVGGAQTAHAGFNANRLLLNAGWMFPLLCAILKEKPAEDRIQVEGFRDFLIQASQVRSGEMAWKLYNDVIIGYFGGKDGSGSYGLTPKVVKVIRDFKKIVEDGTKIGKLNDEYGFISDPEIGPSLIAVGKGHNVYANGQKVTDVALIPKGQELKPVQANG